MKSFFVQPDKQQAKGSAIMFIFSEVYGALELGINGLDKLIAFFGAIAFANVILLSYQLVENNNVPKSWETGTAMIAAVALGFGIFDTAYYIKHVFRDAAFFHFLNMTQSTQSLLHLKGVHTIPGHTSL